MDTVKDFTKLFYMNDRDIDKGITELQNLILKEPFSNDLNNLDHTQQVILIIFIVYFSYIFINLKL